MRLPLACLLLVACQPEPVDFPRSPGVGGGFGGTGNGGGGGTDAAVDGAELIGRVCLVDDLRRLDECATVGADNITVTLGTSSTTTENDGTFTITEPAGTALTWRASGGDGADAIVPSVIGFAADHVIPAIRATDYQDLLDANGAILTPGQGSLVLAVIANGIAVIDAEVSSTPAAQFQTRYDGSSQLNWDVDGTGVEGLAWLTGMSAGGNTITISPPNNAQDRSTDVTIENGAITFATFEL
jgi:hypothetical protein